ncbi:MAG: helix-turn-helix domain-containing protein [Clostridia bacterium]|nr:helix-turn-helix domain-containing protein [Clostridia bacterium]
MTFEELIISRGFEPKKFARVAGLERESIRQYRRGKGSPNLTTAIAIAKALGVTVDEVAACFKDKEE